jgi:hypothetical protein
VFSFFRSVLFIHFVPLYPLSSSSLFLFCIQHKHPLPQRNSNPQTLALDRSATGIGTRSPERRARSESLYRLSYTGPCVVQEAK